MIVYKHYIFYMDQNNKQQTIFLILTLITFLTYKHCSLSDNWCLIELNGLLYVVPVSRGWCYSPM